MRKDNQRGAIVVEATLSLTAFVFTIFTILTLVNVFYIQAKMSVALNSAAKDISQYSYLYYKLGLDYHDAAISEGTEEARKTADNTIDNVSALYESLSETTYNAETGNFEEALEKANEAKSSVELIVDEYASKLSDDPKDFIMGMAKMAASELKEEGKAFLGQVLAKAFMEKNLKAHEKDDPDRFLKHYGIEDGMDGLDFKYSSLMAYGKSNLIQLCVTYDVHVIKLLNVDFKFKFRQVAQVNAWGNGISLIKPEQNNPDAVAGESVWDASYGMSRGDIIIEREKQGKTYTVTSAKNQGFHIYNNAGGDNQFVRIRSIDATTDYYKNISNIKTQLNKEYDTLSGNVSKLGDPITVQNQSGAKIELPSNPDTRTYKIILVVPDNSPMDTVKEAVAQFQSNHEGVVVEINTNHGSKTLNDEDKGEEEKTE